MHSDTLFQSGVGSGEGEAHQNKANEGCAEQEDRSVLLDVWPLLR